MKIIASLLLLVLLGLFIFTDNLNFTSEEKPFPVGKVLTTKGVVMAKSPDDPYFKNIKAQFPLSLPIKILTGFESRVSLEIGSDIQLLEESQAEIFQRGSKIQINLISGTLKRSEPVSENIDVFVNQALQKQAIIEIPKIDIESKEAAKATPTPSQKEERQKSNFQSQLKNTFRLHQRFLERCFIKHYERKKGKTKNGQVLLKFLVDKNGSVQNVDILESEILDKNYHRCIKEVVSRVRIKFHDKKERWVEFPIQITLPL